MIDIHSCCLCSIVVNPSSLLSACLCHDCNLLLQGNRCLGTICLSITELKLQRSMSFPATVLKLPMFCLTGHMSSFGADMGTQTVHKCGSACEITYVLACCCCTMMLALQGTSCSALPSSTYRGLSWDARRNLWQVCSHINGNRVVLGSFSRELEAARAYDAALLVLGSNDLPNFPGQVCPSGSLSVAALRYPRI